MFLSSCTKTSGFTEEDLSETGKWLYQMLTTRQGGAVAEQSENEAVQKETAQDGSNSPEDSKDGQTLVCGDIEVFMYLKNSWEEEGKPVRQYELTVKNTSDQQCTNWAVDIPFEEKIVLTDGWNGDYSVQDQTVHITSKEYNGTIPAGGEIGDVGFIVKTGD